MAPREWFDTKRRLEQALRIARQWVYPRQPEKTKEAAYELLRNAEDALQRHLDSRPD